MNKNEDDSVMHNRITVMRLQITKRQGKGREKDKPGVSRLSSYRHYEMR